MKINSVISILMMIQIFLINYPMRAGSLKISVIVPCYYGHFMYLDELMLALSHQTVLPDEVVISLSEYGKIDPELIHIFEAKQYPFEVKLLKHAESLYAGPNRNKACEVASGDIFICQDADDIPHPQRIEIIKYYFETFDIKHLLHSYSLNGVAAEMYDIKKIKQVFVKQLGSLGHTHHGNIAIKKEVFNKVQWNNNLRGQDVAFNLASLAKVGKMMHINANLVFYRPCLTSYKPQKS